MRGLLRFALACCSLTFVTVACSGGGGGDDDDGFDPGPAGGTLSSGTYEISHWDGGIDECRSKENRNGDQVVIGVVGTSLDWGGIPSLIYGSTFLVAQSGGYDFTTAPYPFGIGPYDCVVELLETIDGLTRGNDRATLERERTVTVVSGAECDDVEDEIGNLAGGNIDFPCTTADSMFIEKIGP